MFQICYYADCVRFLDDYTLFMASCVLPYRLGARQHFVEEQGFMLYVWIMAKM